MHSPHIMVGGVLGVRRAFMKTLPKIIRTGVTVVILAYAVLTLTGNTAIQLEHSQLIYLVVGLSALTLLSRYLEKRGK